MFVETYNENRNVPASLGSEVTPKILIRRPNLVQQQQQQKTSKSNSSIQTTPIVGGGGGGLKPEDLNNNSLNMENYIYQRYNESEENILLCWENYAVPLPELVKSTSMYECNMLEYYRSDLSSLNN